jgi:hypothetical protein
LINIENQIEKANLDKVPLEEKIKKSMYTDEKHKLSKKIAEIDLQMRGYSENRK